jgi:hypothetical protein
MPSHSARVEAVVTQKILMPSEGEALVAANALRELSLDSELSTGQKSQCVLVHRELLLNIGKAQARQECMGRAIALASSIT